LPLVPRHWEGAAVADPKPGDLLDTTGAVYPREEDLALATLATSSCFDAASRSALTAGSPLPAVTLVIGGTRSGKSLYAERLAAGTGSAVYLATAEARDAEMVERIQHHRLRRGAAWTTVEEPLALAAALQQHAAAGRPVLVDCLTLWLANLMAAGRDIVAESASLIDSLANLAGPVVFVSNEVGLGIVPATQLGREFRDHAGRLNQAVAAAADLVLFMVAGLPMILKDPKR
jgi:adenosylcobinamide kinase/adenosylcobinamide-phosphate guanylyltransferase